MFALLIVDRSCVGLSTGRGRYEYIYRRIISKEEYSQWNIIILE